MPRTAAVVVGTVLLPLTVVAGGVVSTTPVAAAPARTLQIVVTNDDGFRAPGIAAISSALAVLPNVHVTVVAPAINRSGTGGTTRKGKLTVRKGKTLNGLAAYAVEGYPADTIRAALNQLHLKPDLVVSGINAGPNLGPVVDLSGTVGAARAAVIRGIPALAASSGFGPDETYDFKAAVPFVVKWVERHRVQLLTHRAKVRVLSMNVPSCAKGSVRGMVRIHADLNSNHIGGALATPNCLSKARPGPTDVTAFRVGFATASIIPRRPSS